MPWCCMSAKAPGLRREEEASLKVAGEWAKWLCQGVKNGDAVSRRSKGKRKQQQQEQQQQARAWWCWEKKKKKLYEAREQEEQEGKAYLAIAR